MPNKIRFATVTYPQRGSFPGYAAILYVGGQEKRVMGATPEDVVINLGINATLNSSLGKGGVFSKGLNIAPLGRAYLDDALGASYGKPSEKDYLRFQEGFLEAVVKQKNK